MTNIQTINQPLSQHIKADGSVTTLPEYQSNYGYQGLTLSLIHI